MSIWGIVLGAAIGAGATCAYKWRVNELVRRERLRAAREMEGERREQRRLMSEVWELRTELNQERVTASTQRVRESAWENGYADGLRDGANRNDAERFLAILEGGGAATMMLRQRRKRDAD